MPIVRITAYPAHWLNCAEGFAQRKRIIWSTGETAQPGEIQLIAVSATLRGAAELAGDTRIDAAHSIWRITSEPGEIEGSDRWPAQARLALLVRLNVPVPKDDLVRAGLLKSRWPEGYAGKVLSRCRDIMLLGSVLAARNSEQRQAIDDALCI
jgi:hypothetical protein